MQSFRTFVLTLVGLAVSCGIAQAVESVTCPLCLGESVHKVTSTSTYHASSYDIVGQEDFTGYDNEFYRAYAWFDVSSVPNNCTVTLVRLNFTASRTCNVNQYYTVEYGMFSATYSQWYLQSASERWSASNNIPVYTSSSSMGAGGTYAITQASSTVRSTVQSRGQYTGQSAYVGFRFRVTHDTAADIYDISGTTTDTWYQTLGGYSLYVEYTRPTISLSTTSLSRSCVYGNNASSQSFTVTNTGGGTLSYSISDNASWLSCSPTSGSSTGESDTITVYYSTSSLNPGSYSATITISSSDATNSPRTVSVSLSVADETISTPSTPTCGSGSGLTGLTYTFSTGGASSNAGHTLQYEFDWGSGASGVWGSATQSKSWSGTGVYQIRARARCATHTTKVSSWSSALSFSVATHTCSTPSSAPSGQANGVATISYDYTCPTCTCNCGGPVEYYFDWGDTTSRPYAVSATASHAWASQGTYLVRAKARCQNHPSIESGWSPNKTVTIGPEMISPAPTTPSPSQPSGVETLSYDFTTGSAQCNAGHPVEYRFKWGDGMADSTWSSSTTASHTFSGSGSFNVIAEARCAVNTALTATSSPLVFDVAAHGVTVPSAPSAGQSGGVVSLPYTFTCGTSTCNIPGHTVEYEFDWGSGPSDTWLAAPTDTHSWVVEDTYQVKARARCADDNTKVSAWSAATSFTVGPEAVNAPTAPTVAPAGNALTGEPYTITTGGAACNAMHSVEYQFDFGDGTQSTWSSSTSDTKTWASAGTYLVKAQARCATNTSVISPWSPTTTVTVVLHSVSAPTQPTGAAGGLTGITYAFASGDSACSSGTHAVEYEFDMGDGTILPWGASTVTYTWSTAGTYFIKARARCVTNNAIISSYSASFSFTVEDDNPSSSDDDGDGIADVSEATLGTNPWLADTDGDGANDGDEVNTLMTDPLDADSDDDGYDDGFEVDHGSDPNDAEDVPVLGITGGGCATQSGSQGLPATIISAIALALLLHRRKRFVLGAYVENS